jgi:hypothetical protein
MEFENEELIDGRKAKRTGKEIRLDGEQLGNSAVNFKIGASFDKHKPETIYIESSFWVDIKEREIEKDKFSFIDYDYEISKKLSNGIRRIYRQDLRKFLEDSEIFPYYLENIFVYDFADNINYNEKRSFVSIQLNLHTINCEECVEESYPLDNKYDKRIYNEAVEVCKIIANSDLLQEKLDFTIHKRKKD